MPNKITIKTRITVNGKEYASVDELPPELRAAYEKAISQGNLTTRVERAATKITFNGREFDSIDQMPDDIRRIYESVMAAVDKDHDGIPDSLESGGDPKKR